MYCGAVATRALRACQGTRSSKDHEGTENTVRLSGSIIPSLSLQNHIRSYLRTHRRIARSAVFQSPRSTARSERRRNAHYHHHHVFTTRHTRTHFLLPVTI